VTRVSGRGARGSGCTVSIAEGTETYLVNGGQVIAVDAEGRSISLGLMLLVFDGNAPVPAAEVASGVQSLARLALERL
jgi:hypothetical protein